MLCTITFGQNDASRHQRRTSVSKNYSKYSLNKCVFRALLKAGKVEIDRTSKGSEFHCFGAQKEKDLSPKRLERTLGTSNKRVSEDDLSVRLGV